MNPTLFIILILIGALATSAFLSYLLLPVKKKKLYETPVIQIEEENTADTGSNDSDIKENSSHRYTNIPGYTSTSFNDYNVNYSYRNSSHDRSTSYVLPSSYDHYYKNVYVDLRSKPFFIRNNINNQNWPKYVRYRVTSKEMLSMFKDEADDGDLSYVESESDLYMKLDNEWVLYTEDNYLDLLMKVMGKKRDGIA